MDILSKLTHPLFKNFTLGELDQLLKITKILVYSPGTVIIKEDEVGKQIYIIIEGKVKVTKNMGPKEGVAYLATLGPEQVIGEISVLTDMPRTATVTSVEETKVLMLDFEEIDKRRDIQYLGVKLLKNLIEELSKKLIYSGGKVKSGLKIEAELSEDQSMSIPTTIFIPFGWKWLDIMYEVPFLSQHGFDSIKVSPPQEFVIRKGRPWWEIYQPVTYNLSQFYGSEEDFKHMIDFCHTFNIKVYVDLVMNHMADYSDNEPEHIGTNGTKFARYSYPGLNSDKDSYEFDDFYHFAGDENLQVTDQDYSKLERIWHLEHYDLLHLPKLNLENRHVIETLRKYVKYLLNLGVDGFRIDAAKHLRIQEIEKIFEDLTTHDGLKPFIYMEYYAGMAADIDIYSYMEKYFKIGYVTSFNYGECLTNAIKSNTLHKLVEYSFGSSWIHYPENRTVVVLDNHDTERMMPNILNYKASQNNGYVLAYIFMLAWNFGIPKIMSSFYFNGMDDSIPNSSIWQNGRYTGFDAKSPWVCQHRWNAIANMVLFRNKTRNAKGITHIWIGDNQVAFARSYQKSKEYVTSLGFVVINGNNLPLKHKFETGLPAGKYYNLIASQFIEGRMQGPTIEVESYGHAEIEVPPHDAVCIMLDYLE